MSKNQKIVATPNRPGRGGGNITNLLSAASLVVVHVDALQLEVGLAAVASGRVDTFE